MVSNIEVVGVKTIDEATDQVQVPGDHDEINNTIEPEVPLFEATPDTEVEAAIVESAASAEIRPEVEEPIPKPLGMHKDEVKSKVIEQVSCTAWGKQCQPRT